jgi:hypothetical protein
VTLYVALALAVPFGLGFLLRGWGTLLVILLMWIAALLLATPPESGQQALAALGTRALLWLAPGVCAAASGMLIGRLLVTKRAPSPGAPRGPGRSRGAARVP